MPTPPNPLWSFLKELFLNKQSLSDYIRRNKLFSLLVVSNTVLFIFVLFVTEQAIQHQERAFQFKKEVERLVAENTTLKDRAREFDVCQMQLVLATKEKAACVTPKEPPRRPQPTPSPSQHRTGIEPVLVPRTYDDDGLRKRLGEIH